MTGSIHFSPCRLLLPLSWTTGVVPCAHPPPQRGVRAAANGEVVPARQRQGRVRPHGEGAPTRPRPPSPELPTTPPLEAHQSPFCNNHERERSATVAHNTEEEEDHRCATRGGWRGAGCHGSLMSPDTGGRGAVDAGDPCSGEGGGRGRRCGRAWCRLWCSPPGARGMPPPLLEPTRDWKSPPSLGELLLCPPDPPRGSRRKKRRWARKIFSFLLF
jgi:hypothetical protein